VLFRTAHGGDRPPRTLRGGPEYLLARRAAKSDAEQKLGLVLVPVQQIVDVSEMFSSPARITDLGQQMQKSEMNIQPPLTVAPRKSLSPECYEQ